MQESKLDKTANAPSSLILKAIIGIILLCSLASGVALYLLKIDLLRFSPKIQLCFFHSITGIPCPFCGMTRAFLAIGQLNFVKAFGFHPLSIIALAIMVIYLCAKKFPLWLQHRAWAYLFLFVTITTWALRLIVR
ncbi:MAG: DUF2752 domain-containing protein [Candidatus Omnitrophota bacterium]|jgi:hypothetical protein